MPQALAPVTGLVVAQAAVPDPVFAGELMGPGLAIEPSEVSTTAIAPIDGRVLKCFPHAFVIEHETTLAVLVHLGLDTIELNGDGFEVCAADGDEVSAGQPMVRWSPAGVRDTGRSAICPVVALEIGPDMLRHLREPGEKVTAGQPLFAWA